MNDEPGPTPERRFKRGTGRPAEGKDRSAHNAARGTPIAAKRSLAHLSREQIKDEEFDASWDELSEGPDRSAAIVGAAFIEEALVGLILSALTNTEDQGALFYDEGAPFRTFSSRTKAAYALGLIAPEVRDDLDRIRSIRNQFAHALRALTFKTPDVEHVARQLGFYPHIETPTPDRSRWSARFVYETACKQLSLRLMQATNAKYQAKASSPFFRAAAALGGQAATSGLLSLARTGKVEDAE